MIHHFQAFPLLQCVISSSFVRYSNFPECLFLFPPICRNMGMKSRSESSAESAECEGAKNGDTRDDSGIVTLVLVG